MRTRFPWPERKSRNPVATPKTKIQAKKTIRFIIALSIPVPELRNANEMHALPRQNLHILLVAKRADLIWVGWYVPGSACPLELELIFPKAMPASRPKESAFEAFALKGRQRGCEILKNSTKHKSTSYCTKSSFRYWYLPTLKRLSAWNQAWNNEGIEFKWEIHIVQNRYADMWGILFSELALESGNGYEDSEWSRLVTCTSRILRNHPILVVRSI